MWGGYVGNVKNCVRFGQGIQIYVNGKRYVGEWENNMRHGQGILYRSISKDEE